MAMMTCDTAALIESLGLDADPVLLVLFDTITTGDPQRIDALMMLLRYISHSCDA
jgi:hypothetical protein